MAKHKKILNIAAGKFKPIELKSPYLLLNVDTMYYEPTEKPGDAEYGIQTWKKPDDCVFYTKEDAFRFMENTIINDFDLITIYRFLEHVSFTQVEYFIYLLSTVTQPGAKVDVIVPNYMLLANMILKDDPFTDKDFAANNILLTTELLNEPSCPHASIWTPNRAAYYFELEKRFKIIEMNYSYKFDGRDIYLRFIAERI
jgi:hypothetical protein